MSTFPKALALLALAAAASSVLAAGPRDYPGIGRAATPSEVAAWDIDVRPDFKGLPAGSGSVARGQEVWEAKCASCHGVFGESNEVFNPLVGGTTADDVKTGRVASLQKGDYPGRTTLMKASTISTLWDYINRAMPWTQPKSLTADEVYAVTAYLLNLGGVLPADFTLSDKTMAQAQQRLPNRNGMTSVHGLWPGSELGGTGKPDVTGSSCMQNCAVDAKVTSALPPHARGSHGNLAQQNRMVGPQRGIDTGRGETDAAAKGSTPQAARPAEAVIAAAAGNPAAVQSLTQQNNCVACHAADRRVVGPSWSEIAGKHAGKTEYLAGKIRSGGSGVWGPIPMPAQSLSEADARSVAAWLASGAKP